MVIRIREYERIGISPDGKAYRKAGGVVLSRSDFAAIKDLQLAGLEASCGRLLFQPAVWNGKEALQCREYVGVVQTPSGLSLEIVPKISRAENDAQRAKEFAVLLKMLCALPEIPFRKLDGATLGVDKTPLLEIFIRCFLEEIRVLIRRGVARCYCDVEENSVYMRGRLLTTQHIISNHGLRDRFYVRHDDFVADRPENRLVKAALLLVGSISRDGDNLRLCRLNLESFSEVPASVHVATDKERCQRDRNLVYYGAALAWSCFLLEGLSPSFRHGRHPCVSLLFPMPHLFERYVALRLREALRPAGWRLHTQARGHFLVEEHAGKPRHPLRPDILLERKTCQAVADTKWKVIDSAGAITQADMYQLFAYSEKCLSNSRTGTRSAFLVYPMTDRFPVNLKPFHFRHNGTALHAVGYDLESDTCVLIDHLTSMADPAP